MTTAIKALGNSGSWFAKVGDEKLPCIHDERIKDEIYTEPYVAADQAKWIKFLDAIRDGKRVIVTTSHLKNGEPYKRKSYVAIYRIEDFVLKDSVMTFRVKDKLQDLV